MYDVRSMMYKLMEVYSTMEYNQQASRM